VLTLRSGHRVLASLVLALALPGCGSDPAPAEGSVWQPSPERAATAGIIGHGDGSSGSVRFEVVFEPSDNGGALLEPTGGMA
jgi:hypothetical protein